MLPDIRNNSRVTLDDPRRSEELWQRVQPFVPSPLFGREAIGLNERWRFYRYEGAPVFGGRKSVLRSDVMYSPAAGSLQ
jgi:hypothetical protein